MTGTPTVCYLSRSEAADLLERRLAPPYTYIVMDRLDTYRLGLALAFAALGTGCALPTGDLPASTTREVSHVITRMIELCPGDMPDAYRAALDVAVDAWASAGAPVYIGCGASAMHATLEGATVCPEHFGPRARGAAACASTPSGVHMVPEHVREREAAWVWAHEIGHLLGAEHAREGLMRAVVPHDEPLEAWSCVDHHAASQVGADAQCAREGA